MIDKEQIKNEFREYLKSGSYDMGKIKESDEVLQEMSIAGRGDWKPNENMEQKIGILIKEFGHTIMIRNILD